MKDYLTPVTIFTFKELVVALLQRREQQRKSCTEGTPEIKTFVSATRNEITSAADTVFLKEMLEQIPHFQVMISLSSASYTEVTEAVNQLGKEDPSQAAAEANILEPITAYGRNLLDHARGILVENVHNNEADTALNKLEADTVTTVKTSTWKAAQTRNGEFLHRIISVFTHATRGFMEQRKEKIDNIMDATLLVELKHTFSSEVHHWSIVAARDLTGSPYKPGTGWTGLNSSEKKFTEALHKMGPPQIATLMNGGKEILAAKESRHVAIAGFKDYIATVLDNMKPWMKKQHKDTLEKLEAFKRRIDEFDSFATGWEDVSKEMQGDIATGLASSTVEAAQREAGVRRSVDKIVDGVNAIHSASGKCIAEGDLAIVAVIKRLMLLANHVKGSIMEHVKTMRDCIAGEIRDALLPATFEELREVNLSTQIFPDFCDHCLKDLFRRVLAETEPVLKGKVDILLEYCILTRYDKSEVIVNIQVQRSLKWPRKGQCFFSVVTQILLTKDSCSRNGAEKYDNAKLSSVSHIISFRTKWW